MNIPSLLPCSSPAPSPSRKATVRSGATKADQSKLPHPLRTSNRQKSAPIIYNRSTAKFPLYHKFPISRQSGCLALQPHDVILSMIFLNFQPKRLEPILDITISTYRYSVSRVTGSTSLIRSVRFDDLFVVLLFRLRNVSSFISSSQFLFQN